MNFYIILIIIALIIIGLVKQILLMRKTTKDLEELNEYSKIFAKFVDAIDKNKGFDNNSYNWLVSKSDRIQNMLGGLGIIDYQYMGIYYKNIAVLLNYLGDIPSIKTSIFSDEQLLNFQSQSCQNAFIRFDGILNGFLEDYKKKLFNPFSCLARGIRTVISLPFKILNSIGLISNDSVEKISNGFIIKILGGILSLITIISAIVSIVVGWEEFIKIIEKIL